MKKDYITFDEYFIGVSYLSSKRSKDPVTKVGACIVKDNKIVGIGYNGFPIGCPDNLFSWDKEEKHNYVVHAELNAILNSTTKLDNAKLYTTLFPCPNCAKAIIQVGIKEVIYVDIKENHKDENDAVLKMFKHADVSLRKVNKIRIDFYED